MRIALFGTMIALLIGVIFSEGRNDKIIGDDGFGPPHVAEEGAGMRLIVNNEEVWESVP